MAKTKSTDSLAKSSGFQLQCEMATLMATAEKFCRTNAHLDDCLHLDCCTYLCNTYELWETSSGTAEQIPMWVCYVVSGLMRDKG